MPDVYDRLVIEGRAFDFTTGLEDFRDGIPRSFPAEIGAIDKYLAAFQACNRLQLLTAEGHFLEQLSKGVCQFADGECAVQAARTG
jgi:phytoene dehydrogenase-like protein